MRECSVQQAGPLAERVRRRDVGFIVQAGALAGVTSLVLLMSAMGIFSLMSVNVSRRTREIGLRTALGANPRHVLAGILSRAMVLMGNESQREAPLCCSPSHWDLDRPAGRETTLCSSPGGSR